MNSAVVFGAQAPLGAAAPAPPFPTCTVDSSPVRAGVVALGRPAFDPADPRQRHMVLVRTAAFSCNFRDKSFIQQTLAFPSSRFSPIGSEFVGEVVAVGEAVESWGIGDRVLTNHHYTGGLISADGTVEGVATNKASRGHHVISPAKLLRVPDAMDDVTAAAFSLNAQTAYSMVRKTGIERGHTVLLTSGTSNVALFLLPVLRQIGAEVYATTTRAERADDLRAMGVREVLVTERGANFSANDEVVELAIGAGLFDRVLDPFFDLHLRRATDILRPMGVYCTCGVLQQGPDGGAEPPPGAVDFGMEIMTKAIIRNLTLMGNCVGLTEDLERALRDYEAGVYDVVVDSVYSGDAFAAFLDRTFSDRDRFGKVVYQF